MPRRKTRDPRKHPVYSAVLHAGASGSRGLPSEPELDALRLPLEHRRLVANACRRAAYIFDDGDHLEARREAEEAAGRIMAALPETIAENDDYLRPAEPVEAPDPRELAARVTRW